jgi:hypothetical protein
MTSGLQEAMQRVHRLDRQLQRLQAGGLAASDAAQAVRAELRKLEPVRRHFIRQRYFPD